MKTSRMSDFTSYLLLRKLVASRVTYASDGVGVTNAVRTFFTMNGAVASCARILSMTMSVVHRFVVSPRNLYAGPVYARCCSKMPVRLESAFGGFFGATPVFAIW